MLDPKLISALSKSDYKKNLVIYLEQVKNEVADIRKGNYSTETRGAVIEVIDKLILNKIKVKSGRVNKSIDDFDDHS